MRTPRTSLEILDAAFARDACSASLWATRPPPKRRAKGRPAKAAKSGGNGKAR